MFEDLEYITIPYTAVLPFWLVGLSLLGIFLTLLSTLIFQELGIKAYYRQQKEKAEIETRTAREELRAAQEQYKFLYGKNLILEDRIKKIEDAQNTQKTDS